MAVSDYNTDPALNLTISGINIAEQCPPGNLNNAIRQMMADVKGLQGEIPSTAGFVTASGAVFSGTQPRYTGRGALLHHNNSANASGRIYVQAQGSANPASPANGDLVFFYAP